MKAFWLKYKGYILHTAGVLIVFLDPSVQHYFAAHSGASAALATIWGIGLHWADGK